MQQLEQKIVTGFPLLPEIFAGKYGFTIPGMHGITPVMLQRSKDGLLCFGSAPTLIRFINSSEMTRLLIRSSRSVPKKQKSSEMCIKRK